MYATHTCCGDSSTPSIAANFPAGTQTLAVGSDGNLWRDDGTNVGTLGAPFTPMLCKPVLWVGGGKEFVGFTANDGNTGPLKYDGTGVSSLGPAAIDVAPPGRHLCVYKN